MVFAESPYDQTEIFRILDACNIAPVFPNLQSVCLSLSKPPAQSNFLYSLDCPKLKSFSLELEIAPDSDDVQAIMRLIADTQELDLTSMSFFTPNPEQITFPILLSISSAIAAQPNLEELDVLDFFDRFTLPFQAAALLHHLTHISFRRHDQCGAFWPDDLPHLPIAQVQIPGFPCFPALTSAKLGVAPEGVSDILAAITSASLISLEVMVGPPVLEILDEGGVPFPISALDGRLGELGRFKALTSFRFTFATSRARFADFIPILDCHQMSFASLRGNGLARWIGNRELSMVAQAWPEIEQLELIDTSQELQRPPPNHNDGHPPSVTLAGLGCLATHCPKLGRLLICVDAREPVPLPFPQVVGTSVHEVRLSYSWVPGEVTAERAVAQFLVHMWPNQVLGSPGFGDVWVAARWNIGRLGGLFGETKRQMERGALPRIWRRVYTLLRSRS